MNRRPLLNRRSFVQQSLVGGAGLVGLGGASAATVAGERDPLSPGGPDSTLQGDANTAADFADRRWVEHTYFLTRKVSQPERFSSDPVIADLSRQPISVAEAKTAGTALEREDEGTTRVSAGPGKDPGWGGNPASAMGTVLPTRDGLAMWYVSPHRVEEPGGKLIGYDSVVRYAVSKDGRHFQQPDLGLCSFRGSRANNVVLGLSSSDRRGLPLSGPRGCSGFCILDATRQPVPHARGRFTALYRTSVPKRGSGLFLAWSDDGMQWNAYPESPVAAGSDTYCNFTYDPRSQRYGLYIRPSAAPAGIRAGPRGVRSLLSRLESSDLIHWGNERVVFDTDEADAPAQGSIRLGREESAADVARGRDVVCYGMTVSPHQGGFIGVAQIYDTVSGHMWCELAHSRDGIDWQREPRREPFIPIGPAGAWDSGMVGYTAAGGPAPVGDDWYFYYTGNNWTHHFKLTAFPERGRMWQIGGVRLKRGRWVGYWTGAQRTDSAPSPAGRGVSAAWANRGELLTRPFRFNGTTIHLNADARRGRVTVGVCDAEGRPLAGFGPEQAVPLQGDGVQLPLAYGAGSTLASLRGRTIRLRLHLESAAVFGLSFG